MNNRYLRRDTRIFISAVTRELGSIRSHIKSALDDNDIHAVEQSSFPPDYRDLVSKLKERISSCDAVIHVAGFNYGAEPSEIPPTSARRSYTQLEYDIALELDKPVYVFLTGKGFPVDEVVEEDEDKRLLQLEHRELLLGGTRDYSMVDNQRELDRKVRSLQLKVEHLRQELQTVDSKLEKAESRSLRSLILISFLVIATILALGYFAFRQEDVANKDTQQSNQISDSVQGVGKSVDNLNAKVESLSNETSESIKAILADPDVLVGKLKSHIRLQSKNVIGELRLANPGDWKKIAEVEERRDIALDRAEALVETIREGISAGADEVFLRAAEILAEEGVEPALEYLESQQPKIDKRIKQLKSRRDTAELELRSQFEVQLFKAGLHITNFEWDAALEIYQVAAATCPNWYSARQRLGHTLLELAKLDEAEPHLRAAVVLAKSESERFESLCDIGNYFISRSKFDLAKEKFESAIELSNNLDPGKRPIALNNIAGVYCETNQLAEAEEIWIKTIELDEELPEFPSDDYGAHLSNLGLLYKDLGRYDYAEALLLRAVRIGLDSGKTSSLDYAKRLNNLALVLMNTGRNELAESLLREALSINEKIFDKAHPEIAVQLNNLGLLFKKSGQYDLAFKLYLYALWVDETTYDTWHPAVARDLNNMATLEFSRSGARAALPIIRAAIEIERKVFGKDDHYLTSLKIGNFGWFLALQDHLGPAQDLTRLSIETDARSLGNVHNSVAVSLTNLALMLEKEGRLNESLQVMNIANAIDRILLQRVNFESSNMKQRKQHLARIRGSFLKQSPESEVPEIQADEEKLKTPEFLERALTRILGPGKTLDEILVEIDRSSLVEDEDQDFWLDAYGSLHAQLQSKSTEESDFGAGTFTAAITAIRGEYLSPAQVVDKLLENKSIQNETVSLIQSSDIDEPIAKFLNEKNKVSLQN